ncbi:hypothetical protein [Coralloluteibacterium thermophilus]|uniref:Phage holin family protein n=1 Tax=Coralloluteibacterium thermophilum TaxID=2707049 RepID=A0ABV9NRG8_9GAMM
MIEKYAVLLASVATVAAPELMMDPRREWLHMEATTAFIGVPFNILVAAAIGSLIGVWKNNMGTKSELLASFLANTLLAATVSVLVPELWGYRWSSAGIHAATAMLLGFTAQSWGPALIHNAAQILRRFLPPRKEGEQ